MVVLVVEDDVIMAEGLCEALAAKGHGTLAASDAHTGLDLLRDHPVELILLDLNLPGGLSGYAACEAYKRLRPDLPVILMTGAFTSDGDARLASHVGASGFLQKPFAISELFAAVEEAQEASRVRPLPLLAFHCGECGAESRIRQQVGDARRVRCPNCGSIRVVGREELTPVGEPRVRLPLPAPRGRILVVDNTEHFRLYLLDLLTEAGHHVVTARDGQEAFRLAEEWLPDLVITEILVPGMDGITLCQHLKAHPRLRRTPVITITNLKHEDYRIHGQQVGVDLQLSKPIQAESLIDTVGALLSRSRD